MPVTAVPVPCFMVEPSDLRVLTLGRNEKRNWSQEGPIGSCPLQPADSRYRWHRAPDVELVRWRGSELPRMLAGWGHVDLEHGHGWHNCGPATNPLNHRLPWPTHCDCGYAFGPEDERSLMIHRWWWRVEDHSDERANARDFGGGAMYWAPWADRLYRPQLEHCLGAVIPGGVEWIIDSQATNCTIPEDFGQRQHHCWSLDGVPPKVTAGKRGPTCSAGAGSIAAGDYHGFLQDGVFTPG